MFDAVARRYDVTNTVLSLGQDRLWRQATRRALDPKPGERILDLAAGTAVSSAPLARAGAEVVAADFSLGMLGAATRRPNVQLVAADGLSLPFAESAFDAATISFGLRNVADPLRCLAELRRVVRPGGRLVVCEFSRPVWAPFRTLYVEYLMRALPAVARAVSSSPDAYVYLAESIRAWPDQAALAQQLEEAGWREVRWRNLSGGIVALHRAFAPGDGGPPTSAAPAATRAQIAT
jgi:demethylmenaquinone methyltransferase/2-methoxy-6-polyprenyl-1,4-benzoquinol methylase